MKKQYFSDEFLRVSAAKIRVFYRSANVELFPNVWKNDLSNCTTGFYGLVRVFYGSQKYSYLGTMSTMKVVMTDRLGCFLVSWHYTVALLGTS